ncbi:MAG: ROK family protein [bacterium]
MSFALGIDLGATNIKLVAVREDGTILDRQTEPTHDHAARRWATHIKTMINRAETSLGTEATWIGLAAPGLAARDHRAITCMPERLQGLESLDWTVFLQRANPVKVLNDAHAALYGEHWLGAAKDFENVVLLTLGTGVGGAILSRGELMTGTIGRAGHLGHICLNPDAPKDIVNTPGSIEMLMGDYTILERSQGRFHSSQELVAAHLAGNRTATEIWMKSVYALSCALSSLVNVLDPEAVIIGGGISRAGAALFEPLQKFMTEVEWRPGGHCVKIMAAQLGDWAGAFGAARFAMKHVKR